MERKIFFIEFIWGLSKSEKNVILSVLNIVIVSLN